MANVKKTTTAKKTTAAKKPAAKKTTTKRVTKTAPAKKGGLTLQDKNTIWLFLTIVVALLVLICFYYLA